MRIDQLVLQTSKLQELAAFYSGVMELPVESFNGDDIKIETRDTQLVFEPAIYDEPFYHFAFNIPANKIDEAHHWLAKRTKLVWLDEYKSDIADFVNWNAKSVYFFDPAGNIVELIARFDLDNATAESFSSKHILNVSEAGLVFKENELEERTTKLIKNYGLNYFSRQPPLPQFKVVGDDEGLFVIVPENRNWFPTNKPAGIFPMEIIFDGNKLEV